MKKKLPLVLLVLAVRAGQPLYGQADEYFPLHIGNTWVFDHYEWPDIFVGQNTISIVDSLDINGKTFFLFDRFFTINGLKSVYLRTEEDKVYRYQDGREELWFDLGANEGDSWQIETYYRGFDSLIPVKVELREQNLSYSINDRIFENCYDFGFYVGPDFSWGYTLAPQVGCVLLGIGAAVPGHYSFRYGVINGIVYPDLVTSVESKQKLEQDATSQSMLSVYPNPFNSSTRLVLNRPKALADINPEINIYDIKGRRVKTFSTALTSAIQISWNGENDKGMIVSSGIYFIVFYFNNKLISKKLIFVQ